MFLSTFSDTLTDPDVLRRVAYATILFFTTTMVSFIVGRWWGKFQARREWNRKHFLGRIIVSLNSFNEGWLRIRTIFERSLEEVFLNPIAVDKIRSACKHTTTDNPLLPIDPKDRWYLLNYVLNAVAEKFSESLVRRDAGQPLQPVPYLLFLTCEMVGEDRIRKVRAMMIRKDLLEAFPHMESMPELEREWHRDRIYTLRRAAEMYRKEPDQFLTLEICV